MNYDLFIPPAIIERGSTSGTVSGRGAGRRAVDIAASRGTGVEDLPGFSPPGRSASDRPSAAEVESTVAAANDVLEQANVGLRYRIDERTEDLVVSVVDRDTGEVLRQVPPDQILRMRQRMQELMGILFDVTA
ncbi:MAG: flagellar protein FlaG [Candidatus Zixiibacteriota bacterium]